MRHDVFFFIGGPDTPEKAKYPWIGMPWPVIILAKLFLFRISIH